MIWDIRPKGIKTFVIGVVLLVVVVGCVHARINQLPDNQYEIISEVPASIAFPNTEYAESMMRDQAAKICPNYEIVEFKKARLSWLHGRTYYKWVIRCKKETK